MMERILVTGATGFAGTHLTKALRARWPATRVVGLYGSVPPAECVEGITYQQANLLDTAAVESVLADVRPDAVIHLAAQSSVSRGLEASAQTWTVNLSGSLGLALAIARHAPEAIVLFASTSEIYGASFLDSPVDEGSAALPMNDYAKSKLAAEHMFAAVLPKTTRLIIARPFNHTGPGQRLEFVLPSFATQIALIEATRQEPQLHVGNLDVSRDFLDVRDVVQAYLDLCEVAPRLPPRFTVNIASGEARPLRSLLAKLRDLSKVPFEIVADPARMRPLDLPIAYGRANLIQAVTGWRPNYPIESTLQDLLTAARKNAADA